jgi:hypothetical protein
MPVRVYSAYLYNVCKYYNSSFHRNRSRQCSAVCAHAVIITYTLAACVFFTNKKRMCYYYYLRSDGYERAANRDDRDRSVSLL